MSRLFHADSRFMSVLGTLSDLVIVNLLWVLCALPVITLGASSTALYGVIKKLAAKEAISVTRTFFQIFRENIRQAIRLSLILAIPVLLICGYLFLILSGTIAGWTAFQILGWIAIALVAIVCSYTFALLAFFDNTISGTLKNAMLLPFSNPLCAIAVAVLNFLPIILFIVNISLFLHMGFFWIIIGGSLTKYLNYRIVSRQFERFCPDWN